MAKFSIISDQDEVDALRALARLAAQKILSKDKQGLPADPRDPIFATEYIRECDRLLANTPLLVQEAIESAGHAAEGANVDPYQGVVEVLQNAEDRRAGEVRVTLRDGSAGRQMLILHNGLPVEYEHVLAMMLPFVSTKRDDADLRGRFGIGLKTLRRICTDIEVHGVPYHFGSTAGVGIAERPAEDRIDEFYEPATDTLLVLNLEDGFDTASFECWFEEWTDDGLIFLDHVRRFELRHEDGRTSKRATKASAWIELKTSGDELARLQRRTVTAGDRRYRVHRGFILVPEGQARFHKRTGTTTPISIASAGIVEATGIFIGFRTRIPTALPFSIDGQFDPTSSRESIQDNKWNAWLLKQAGTVIAQAASRELSARPRSAWNLVPIASEGVVGEQWPAATLQEAFERARTRFNALARFGPEGNRRLSDVAYEEQCLGALLTEEDLAALAPEHLPLTQQLRDDRGRWRRVVEALGVSRQITPKHLIGGMTNGIFAGKGSAWWVEAASTLTNACPPEQIFGAPIWLCDKGYLVGCKPIGTSDRKLVFGATLPFLAERHSLFDVLHPAFVAHEGKAAIDWLVRHAAFTTEVDAHDELLAFAAAFENDPVRLSHEELRELRDLLDPLTGLRAQKIGARLGAAVLIEAVEAETKGKRSWRRPSEVYLPKAIDKDTPHWPNAAWGIAGIWWVHPSYEEGLRTGLGKRRKRDDGTRSRGARNFLALLGAESGPRLEPGRYVSERSDARRASMARANATRLSSDIRSSDLDRVLRVITNRKVPKKERKERAAALLRSLSRDWGKRLQDQSQVEGEHTARVYTYARGKHDALWLDRLKDTAWMPVGRERFMKPAHAAVKTAETQAIYKSEDFVIGVSAEELDEDFVEAIGLTARVRVNDLLAMLENMRDGKQEFDAARVYFAYQHFARLIPKSTWVSTVGETTIAEFRERFAAKEGLVLVEVGEGTADWRRPAQVRRGKPIVPDSTLYVPEREIYRTLWNALRIGETTIEDCCDYLRTHAGQYDPSAERGILIQVYRHMNALMVASGGPAAACRFISLACYGMWRARRPIYLVADDQLRDRLATALPEQFFWQPPCDTRSIETFVDALAVTRITPRVLPLADKRAQEEGQDLTPTFQAAVDHLSNSLGKRDASLRQTLRVSWDALRTAKIYVYDGEVPVDVEVDQLGRGIRTTLQAHLVIEPLELHVASDALEIREGAGAAISSLFDAASVFPFDAEWVLAWQAAKRTVADALRFAVDDAAHKAKVESAATEINSQKGKGPVKLTRRAGQKATSSPPPLPPRELKDFQPGIASVTIVEGKPAKQPKSPVKNKLGPRPDPSRVNSDERVANTRYTNGQVEDFGWEVLIHVLERCDGVELEDFRRRHGVGADGAFDWGDFVELKATGRSMQNSVSLSPTEFKRALEQGNDYILALVHNCEKGNNTKVKLIFDPARRASIRETEGIRLNGLPEAPGVVIELGRSDDLTGWDSQGRANQIQR
ncbi:ATP-binding protein [Mesorhizobium sp. Cs1321R2N1]|uniref:ATP-binding protein n=1 Tax=Mesorhizobium sp. Cs1321R2N1 TaxID=3015174 RepID=UPI00301E2E40